MMRHHLPATLGAAIMIVSAGTIAAQDQAKAPTTVELTGCVSLTASEDGQYAFVDGASGGTYRLNGKGLKKYAGQRISIVGDPSSKRPKIRLGLWPSPNVAAQAGALDPAQESIARQSGGAASIREPAPELRVVRVRGVEGSCQ
jgi:hypothetical protein